MSTFRKSRPDIAACYSATRPKCERGGGEWKRKLAKTALPSRVLTEGGRRGLWGHLGHFGTFGRKSGVTLSHLPGQPSGRSTAPSMPINSPGAEATAPLPPECVAPSSSSPLCLSADAALRNSLLPIQVSRQTWSGFLSPVAACPRLASLIVLSLSSPKLILTLVFRLLCVHSWD